MTRPAKGVGLDLVAPGRRHHPRPRQGAPRAPPHRHAGEIALFLSGRGAAAHVEIDGDPDAAAVLRGARLRPVGRSRRTPTQPWRGGTGSAARAVLGCDAEVDRTEPSHRPRRRRRPLPPARWPPTLPTGLGAPAGPPPRSRGGGGCPRRTVVSRPGGRRAGPVSRRGGRRVDSAPGRHPDPRSPVAVGGARGPRPGPHHGSAGRRAAPRRVALALSVTVYHRLITRSAFDETLAGRELGSALTAVSGDRARRRFTTDGQGRDHPDHPRARGHRPHRQRATGPRPRLRRRGRAPTSTPSRWPSPTAPAAPRTRPRATRHLSRLRPGVVDQPAPTGGARGAPGPAVPGGRRRGPAPVGVGRCRGTPSAALVADIGAAGPGPAHTRTRARHRGTARGQPRHPGRRAPGHPRRSRRHARPCPSPSSPWTPAPWSTPGSADELDSQLNAGHEVLAVGGAGARRPRDLGVGQRPRPGRPSTSWRRRFGHVVVPPGRRVGSHRAAHPHPALHLDLGQGHRRCRADGDGADPELDAQLSAAGRAPTRRSPPSADRRPGLHLLRGAQPPGARPARPRRAAWWR